MAERIWVKPRVRFLGWREDVPALMAACDVFVCPSRHEPLGNVILEAWAQGLPVVATDSIGPGRLIRHLESGLLVPVDDGDGLSRAIRYLLEEEEVRARIAQGGRAAFEAEFTEAIVMRKYVEFFESLLSENHT
jgi:glycosyltransferase involved in cell wall biosynthesis